MIMLTREPTAAELRLCSTCRWSLPSSGRSWSSAHECTQPGVLQAHTDAVAVVCAVERTRRRAGTPCGVGGKLWEARA